MSDQREFHADSDHWLVRRRTQRLAWIAALVLLALAVAADLVVEHHPYFDFAGTIGFGAWFGFLSCVAVVLFARAFGFLLQRRDDYYDR